MTTAWWLLACGYVLIAGYVLGYSVALWEYDIQPKEPGEMSELVICDKCFTAQYVHDTTRLESHHCLMWRYSRWLRKVFGAPAKPR